MYLKHNNEKHRHEKSDFLADFGKGRAFTEIFTSEGKKKIV